MGAGIHVPSGIAGSFEVRDPQVFEWFLADLCWENPRMLDDLWFAVREIDGFMGARGVEYSGTAGIGDDAGGRRSVRLDISPRGPAGRGLLGELSARLHGLNPRYSRNIRIAVSPVPRTPVAA